MRCFAIENDLDALEHVGGDLVTPALVPDHLLQPAVEIRVVGARAAGDEVLLDLHADTALELTVQVELEAPEYLCAINR